MAISPIQSYINSVKEHYNYGNATEHTYRSDLQILLTSLGENLLVTNEPKRQECGAPDYIITRKDIPLGFVEAKDVGDFLDKTEKGEQLKRYKESLDNLILTDYLEFRLYRFGNKVSVIRIAEVVDGKIVALKGNWTAFQDLITEFYAFKGTTITSADKLAKMMAAKAKMMHEVIEKALTADLQVDPYQQSDEDTSLKQQFQAFKEVLIHDIKPGEFADIYAQTIAYGMFAARLNDTTLEDFSRKEAAELVPKSNPFLRKLFQYIAGYDLDTRLDWIVDALAEVFAATDVKELLKDFGISTQTTDPIIHFYETFLGEYNPALRKSRGVYYTPQPVVNFIVRAVDEILKEEFGLPQGLADTSKIKIKVDQQGKKIEKEVHKVQILDPACGTGTFLAEVIRQIYSKFEGQQGIWNDYVEQHIIPRLNGFEILMASYAMCHLKLELLLRETGYKPYEPKRLRVFLTNSLEEAGENKRDLFTQWLTEESIQANTIKRDTPVMVVLGNPPYSVSSNNKSPWIEKLLAAYKQNLNERNIQPLSDDYIKFIRFGQHFIDKNGEGVLAYISNNSFIDGIIHRQMRKNLMESFDKIYILDLHGNAKKNEKTLKGALDQNVFDIMQGVSINIFVKNGLKKKGELSQLLQYDLFGSREFKYDFLNNNSLSSINYITLNVKQPEYFYFNKNYEGINDYNMGFKIDEIFILNSVGIVTSKDAILINELEDSLIKNVESYYKISYNKNLTKKIAYRVFENKLLYYDVKLIDRARDKVMRHMFKQNIALITPKQAIKGFQHIFVSNTICDKNLIDSAGQFGAGNVFPLYLYNFNNGEIRIDNIHDRLPNFTTEFITNISKSINLHFSNEKDHETDTFAPLDIFDYIYSILHSPTYRKKYNEFLKIEFPRVPYPTDKEVFWKLAALGGELRQLHLLESPKVNQFITSYPEPGDNEVTKVFFEGDDTGKVCINTTQYFDKVPRIAWEFYIGGYQPAQKWLKDRKGRRLSFEDIIHYQRVIIALTETKRIMREIDEVVIF